MARLKIKYDRTGDHCLSTADDVNNAIQMALESAFFTDQEHTSTSFVKIVSFTSSEIKFSATVQRWKQETMKIIGTAIPRVSFYKDDKDDKIVKSNLYLMIDWSLA